MGGDHNFLMVTFENDSSARAAVSRLKQASRSGRVEVMSAALIERAPDGSVSVSDAADAVIGTGIAGGGLLGVLARVLGSPAGIVLGFGAGAVVADTLPPGHTALVAEADEYAVEVVDCEMLRLGGVVLRIPAAEVLTALEAAERAAEDETRRLLREQRREHRGPGLDDIEAER